MSRDKLTVSGFEIDLFAMLHYNGGPEEFLITYVYRPLRHELLEQFYQRFPDQRPEINSANPR